MFPPACKSCHQINEGRRVVRSVPIATLSLLGVLMIAGCQPHMVDQPRVDTLQPSAAFADGLGQRPPMAGTIARGRLPIDSPEETGLIDGKPIDRNPLEISDTLLARGQQRFQIYCAPCHGAAGFGDGMVVQRGFPAPPSYHISRLQMAPDGELFKVISQGRGRMPPFGKRIEPHDSWAIVAYVRALQLSQSADIAELPEVDKLPFTSSEAGALR
ncbi:MAG: hypothetical protein JWP89_2327 [Schlesneria sp.]|nr:hypothetical protein [Schlesneria sp.]